MRTNTSAIWGIFCQNSLLFANNPQKDNTPIIKTRKKRKKAHLTAKERADSEPGDGDAIGYASEHGDILIDL